MAAPQTGIFALGTAAHAYLEFDLLAQADGPDVVAAWRVSGSRGRRSAASTWWRASGPSCGQWSRPTRRRSASSASTSRSWRRRPRATRDAARRRGLVGGCLVRRRVRYVAIDRRRAHGARDARPRDGRLAVPPRSGPDGIRGRHARTRRSSRPRRSRSCPPGLPGEGASILLLQQWEHDAIAWEAMPVDVAGSDHRSPQVGQRGTGPSAADIARHAHRPGPVRQDLPAQRRVRDHVRARDDLRRASAAARDRSARCSRAWWAPGQSHPTN